MIGKNSVIFNMEQVKAIFAELFRDADLSVTGVSFNCSKSIVTVDLGPKIEDKIEATD